MDKTTLISAKIDADFKHKAEQIFRELGLTPTQAITLFYKQVDLQHSLPFVPNEVIRKALEDARKRRNLKSFDSLESLFEDLEN